MKGKLSQRDATPLSPKSRTTWNKSGKWSERDLNSGSPDVKSATLTTRPHSLHLFPFLIHKTSTLVSNTSAITCHSTGNLPNGIHFYFTNAKKFSGTRYHNRDITTNCWRITVKVFGFPITQREGSTTGCVCTGVITWACNNTRNAN